MQLTIEIEVQGCESSDISVTNQCENLTLEIIDAPTGGGGDASIDDSAGIGDTDVTWSADKSARELADKVDKVEGYSLVDDAEIAKLATVQENATANRDDSLNADKVHDHTVSQVVGLSDRLDSIDSLIGDVESVLVAINGEP